MKQLFAGQEPPTAWQGEFEFPEIDGDADDEARAPAPARAPPPYMPWSSG